MVKIAAIAIVIYLVGGIAYFQWHLEDYEFYKDHGDHKAATRSAQMALRVPNWPISASLAGLRKAKKLMRELKQNTHERTNNEKWMEQS